MSILYRTFLNRSCFPSLVMMSSSSSTTTKMSMSTTTTTTTMPSLADLCDTHLPSPTRLSVVEPGLFHSYGQRSKFYGKIETVRCFESNPTVRSTLSTPGHNRILVVDGGGSKRVAIFGDQIAQLAIDNSWSGVIIYGCIRDSAIINNLPIGVKACGTHPVKSLKSYIGERGVPVNFGGVEFIPGQWVYSDEDGIIVSEVPLHNVVESDSDSPSSRTLETSKL